MADVYCEELGGSSLNSQRMRVGICIRFPLPITALKFTWRVSGINRPQPKSNRFSCSKKSKTQTKNSAAKNH